MLHTLKWTLRYHDGRFAWVQTGAGVHQFLCDGVCALIATTQRRPSWPLEPTHAARYGPLAYRELLPWWFTVDVPALRHARLIRFNAGYDAHWRLLGSPAQHLRIDAAVNGWILPASKIPRTLTVVHSVSLLQAAFCGVGLLWTLSVLAFAFWKSSARYQVSA